MRAHVRACVRAPARGSALYACAGRDGWRGAKEKEARDRRGEAGREGGRGGAAAMYYSHYYILRILDNDNCSISWLLFVYTEMLDNYNCNILQLLIVNLDSLS